MNRNVDVSASRDVDASSYAVRLRQSLRVASIVLMLASLVAAGTLPAAAEQPVERGPTVTVTGSRNEALTPSEGAYVATLSKTLQRASRYPSGRDASLDRPSGTATVWVQVTRDGRVTARGVEQSSGAAMLDQMAKALVGRHRFPAFASGDWTDGPGHRFIVSYRFDGPAMTAGR